MNKCSFCQKVLEDNDTYEYRGALSCGEDFDNVIERRDNERNQIIQDEDNKTKVFKGLDLTDSVIGKANRKLLSRQIEVASKESAALKNYERPSGKNG